MYFRNMVACSFGLCGFGFHSEHTCYSVAFQVGIISPAVSKNGVLAFVGSQFHNASLYIQYL
jgi:hypothetical protein